MNLLQALRSRRLLAIIRAADAAAAVRCAIALAEEGVSLIEVSLNTPCAFAAIAGARAAIGAGTEVGAGTVVTAADAHRAADAGAAFIVTPAITAAVAAASERGLPLLCGALSPSEVVMAAGHGAAAVKLFPASPGGPGYLRALRDPFPDIGFVPVGGVDAGSAREYLAAGAVAVGAGAPLVGDAASGGSLAGLRARARRFLAATAAADGPAPAARPATGSGQ